MMLTDHYDKLVLRLNGAGQWLALAGLRLLLAWEFWSAGRQKLAAGMQAPDWFAEQAYPLPFSLMSADANWILVTWSELLGAIGLLLGLLTRLSALFLIGVTTIAIVAVHWPDSWSSLGQLWEGYSVSRVVEDGEFRGNFRIPLLFLAMLMPLLFLGGGRLSLDHLLARVTRRTEQAPVADAGAFAAGALVFGLIAVNLIPWLGISLLLVSAGLLVLARLGR